MVTHLELDILECEVKWALGRITTNIASGRNGIPAELFQIIKDDSVKVLHSICQQIWKTQQWPQDWKKSVFIQIPKKGNAKECSNYQIITLISHTSKIMLKILQARIQQYMNLEIPRYTSWVSKRQRNHMSNCQHLLDPGESKGIPKSICFIDYAKDFDCIDHNKLWKILKKIRVQDHLTYLLRNLYVGQEAIEPGQQTGSKLGKEYYKTIYYHPAYLNSVQSTSWKCQVG